VRLCVLEPTFAIARLPPTADASELASLTPFVSITRTPRELSVVLPETDVDPTWERVERGWRALAVEGPLDFELTGVIAAIAAPLAAAEIGIFVVATYETDYLLVRSAALDAASEALRSAGHEVA
jgi:hypothetical protein